MILKKLKWNKSALVAFVNCYELIILHLLFLRNWATTSSYRMWWCKYLKLLSPNLQVTELYCLFLGIIHAWTFIWQQQSFFKKLKKKCTLWFLSEAFVNFGKFWEQILSEGKVCVLAIKNLSPHLPKCSMFQCSLSNEGFLENQQGEM